MEAPTAPRASPVTKFQPPRLRQETIARDRLIDRLRGAAAPLALVTGPAGSGKSIVLAQWYGTEPQAMWMSLDDTDNDPVVFWSSLIDGLDQTIPGAGARIRRSVVTTGGLTAEGAIAAVVNELVSHEESICIFLDDAHVLTNDDCTAPIPLLAQRLPERCRLVVASRSSDLFPVGKLRLQGALTELDAHALAMSDAEAGELFATIGVETSTDDIAALNHRAEGWIAGLLMAAQLLQQRSDARVVLDEFDGSDRDVAEYLIGEVIERLPADDRTFLLRTSILPRLRGDLCDAVSGLTGSAERLDRLERANAFVIPLDRQRRWYRYHHLFAELLVDLLGRQHPDEVDDLHRKASEWCEAEGLVLEAIDHALTAGQRREAAVLLAQHWYDLANSGQIVTARRLIERFTADEIMAFQPLALTAAWIKGVTDPGGSGGRRLPRTATRRFGEHEVRGRAGSQRLRVGWRRPLPRRRRVRVRPGTRGESMANGGGVARGRPAHLA